MENIEELLDFFLVANDETRRNVTGLMKVFHEMVPVVLTSENQPLAQIILVRILF